jgi:hypothetical protein
MTGQIDSNDIDPQRTGQQVRKRSPRVEVRAEFME